MDIIAFKNINCFNYFLYSLVELTCLITATIEVFRNRDIILRKSSLILYGIITVINIYW